MVWIWRRNYKLTSLAGRATHQTFCFLVPTVRVSPLCFALPLRLCNVGEVPNRGTLKLAVGSLAVNARSGKCKALGARLGELPRSCAPNRKKPDCKNNAETVNRRSPSLVSSQYRIVFAGSSTRFILPPTGGVTIADALLILQVRARGRHAAS